MKFRNYQKSYHGRNIKWSHIITWVSIFILISAFLIGLPLFFFLIGGSGLILAYLVYGYEGYQYFHNKIRLVLWSLIPFIAAIYAYYQNDRSLILGSTISQLILFCLFAVATASLYYTRRGRIPTLFILIGVSIISITIIGFFIPSATIHWNSFFSSQQTVTGGTAQNPLSTDLFKPPPTIAIPTLPPIPSISYTDHTTMEKSKEILNYVNSLRQKEGRSTLSFDDRVYNLAMARVNDMDKYR